MKYPLVTLCLFIGFSFFVSCNNDQNTISDSLNKKNLGSDMVLVVSQLSAIQDVDSLAYRAGQASGRYFKRWPDSLKAGFCQQLGLLFYQRAAYDQAYEYLIQSERYFRLAAQHGKAIRMMANQAVLLELKGNYKEAINLYLQAAKYFMDIDDKSSLAQVYTNIAIVYQEMGVADKSLYYNRMGLSIRLKSKDTLSCATNFNNIGVLNDELFGQLDSALYYYDKAVAVYTQYGVPLRLAYALNNMARMHLALDNLTKAGIELSQAYFIMDSLGNPHGKAKVLRNQGELYFQTGRVSKALEVFTKSLTLFEHVKDKKGILEVSQLLSKVYMAQGNYALAATMLEKESHLKDTLLNRESQSIIAEMETRYQVKEKNKAIQLLELQDELNRRRIRNQVWVLLLLAVISVLILVVFFINHNRHKLKDKQLRLELQNYLLRIDTLKHEVEKRSGEARFSVDKLNDFQLSDREVEVLKLIASGYKNAEIAERLFVSQNTIKTHIKNIYIKLDVKNRVEALKKVDIV